MSTSIDLQHLLKNQKALVNGASWDFCKPCALALGAPGADVVVNYTISQNEAESVVDAICKNGGTAIALKADVSVLDQYA